MDNNNNNLMCPFFITMSIFKNLKTFIHHIYQRFYGMKSVVYHYADDTSILSSHPPNQPTSRRNPAAVRPRQGDPVVKNLDDATKPRQVLHYGFR